MPLTQNARNKLDALLSRHAELETELGRSEVIANREKLGEYSKEFTPLAEIASANTRYEQTLKELENCRASLEKEKDSDMAAMFNEEILELEAAAVENETKLTDLLFPKAAEKHLNIILEVRAGPGGLEAALFAGDLHRMYTRYVEIMGWKTELISASPSPMGGFKEIIFAVKGREAYSRLQFESGVHRVQRIPVTEAGGRIHTSTATVAVLPEPEEIDEVPIDPGELRIDTFRASGKGGQHVNKTDSAIRITHLPTGITVECQDERSQHQNKAKAMRFLRARLLKIAQETQMEEIARDRKSQVGTGERSEKIRTYNFPQNRVTDHRAGVSVYKLSMIIDGYMEDILDPVVAFFRENSEQTAAMSAADR